MASLIGNKNTADSTGFIIPHKTCTKDSLERRVTFHNHPHHHHPHHNHPHHHQQYLSTLYDQWLSLEFTGSGDCFLSRFDLLCIKPGNTIHLHLPPALPECQDIQPSGFLGDSWVMTQEKVELISASKNMAQTPARPLKNILEFYIT